MRIAHGSKAKQCPIHKLFRVIVVTELSTLADLLEAEERPACISPDPLALAGYTGRCPMFPLFWGRCLRALTILRSHDLSPIPAFYCEIMRSIESDAKRRSIELPGIGPYMLALSELHGFYRPTETRDDLMDARRETRRRCCSSRVCSIDLFGASWQVQKTPKRIRRNCDIRLYRTKD